MTTLFSSLPEVASVMDPLTIFKNGASPLLELHDEVLRDESALSVGERELIAAYVSGLNACNYCFGAHVSIASSYGIDEHVFEQLIEDPEGADIDSKLKPLLAYVRKLTLSMTKMIPSDAEAVYAAGWDERALYDVIMVCALFNFMNRLVEGTGCKPGAYTDTEASPGKIKSYVQLGKMMEVQE